MTKWDKALERLKRCPKDYTYDELSALLLHLGYVEDSKGKTSGSRVRFYRNEDDDVIDLHIPHPKRILKRYAILAVISKLESNGDL